MSVLLIEGGTPLRGEITAAGNKNAALPMIAAALLTDQPVTLHNVPAIRDVDGMLAILDHLGVEIEHPGPHTLRLCAANLRTAQIPQQLCAQVRTSFLCVAPLLHRLQKAQLFPPGGDVIGRRRLDAHIYGLRKLGAECDLDRFQFAAPNRLAGYELFFDEASVTATEHILMAAVLAEGKTIIRNAASEPHVQNLARMLQEMGARIEGVNTNTLTIHGVDTLGGTTARIDGDHIEVGSFLAAAAATGGELTVRGVTRGHYWMINRVFERFGINLEIGTDTIVLPPGQVPKVKKEALGGLARVDDGPWPQFPSDLMSSMLMLATQAEGTVLFFEKMFESRLYFVDSLLSMGAQIIVCDPHRVVVTGKTPLRGQSLRSPDIRAGISLLSAALCARGQSRLDNAEIIDRGYESIEQRLQSLGARISRA